MTMNPNKFPVLTPNSFFWIKPLVVPLHGLKGLPTNWDEVGFSFRFNEATVDVHHKISPHTLFEYPTQKLLERGSGTFKSEANHYLIVHSLACHGC